MKNRLIAAMTFAALTSIAFAQNTASDSATTAGSTNGDASASSSASSQAAPDFSAKDESGKEHSLAAYQGKPVVLFWTNPGSVDGDDLKGGCPYITGRVKQGSIEKLAKNVQDKGGVFLAVNSGGNGKADDSKQVAEKFNQSYPTLQDPDGKIGKSFNATNTPQVVVIDTKGQIAYNGALNDNASPDASKDASAKDYVIPAVEAAAKGEKPAVTKTKAYGCGVKYAKAD